MIATITCWLALLYTWLPGVSQASVVRTRRTGRCTSSKCSSGVPPNGERYPLVGGTRQRYFIGTNFKPHKLPENAQTPTSRVHAVLGGLYYRSALSASNSLANLMPR